MAGAREEQVVQCLHMPGAAAMYLLLAELDAQAKYSVKLHPCVAVTHQVVTRTGCCYCSCHCCSPQVLDGAHCG
jgi:hypothetical protein